MSLKKAATKKPTSASSRRSADYAAEVARPDLIGVMFKIPRTKRDRFKAATAARGEHMRDVLEGFVDEYLAEKSKNSGSIK